MVEKSPPKSAVRANLRYAILEMYLTNGIETHTYGLLVQVRWVVVFGQGGDCPSTICATEMYTM